MIAKIPSKRKDGRSSFQALTDYCRGLGQGQNETVTYLNIKSIRSIETASVEMASVAAMNTRCKDAVYHFILSWREFEYPSNKQVDEGP